MVAYIPATPLQDRRRAEHINFEAPERINILLSVFWEKHRQGPVALTIADEKTGKRHLSRKA